MNLLLHMCCGPCACYPVEKLRADGHQLTGYFFNPNIHPYKEFRRRLTTAEEFAQKVNLPLIVDNKYQLREFLQKALTIEEHTDGLNLDNRRCRMCYAWRLHEAALYAKEHGFDAFTSTLFVSPYQNHQMMKDVAEKISRAVDIPFYYEDFRPGYERGVDISLELELYRQPYCGCIFSEEERYSNSFKKKRRKKLKALHENQSVNKGNDNNEQSS